jgi:hypothetical protein
VNRRIDQCTAEELFAALYSAGVDMDRHFVTPVTVAELRIVYRKLLAQQLREWKAENNSAQSNPTQSVFRKLAQRISYFTGYRFSSS